MKLEGKGFYLWRIKETEGGNVNAIASLSKQAGLTHVLIKVADGGYSYNYDWKNKVDYVPPLVNALRARGISPWGWHYVRGDAPSAEARKAAERVKGLGLDGYVIDAEQEYKGRHQSARTFMTLLRKELPNTPVALSSYRYPSYHPKLPWNEFLEKCDFNMPQVYWEGSNNPRLQLERSLKEFRSLSTVRPIFPTGAAYTERNWKPTPGQIKAFLDGARDNKLPGSNFWEFSAARKLGLWQTIASYEWGEPPAPKKDIPQMYIETLNTRQPDLIMKLYTPNAVHINASRTVQGLNAIRAWYAQFFVVILPNARFALTGFTGKGASRHLTWQAVSARGKVFNGNDTFGLASDGKIAYHYTFFTVVR